MDDLRQMMISEIGDVNGDIGHGVTVTMSVDAAQRLLAELRSATWFLERTGAVTSEQGPHVRRLIAALEEVTNT